MGLMMAASTFLDETSSSLGKWSVNHKKESVYTFGFLNLFWGLIFFIVIAIYKQEFVFSMNSIGLFAIYIVLEIAQTYSSLEATVKAERSTFAFIMVGTVPLLLVVDYSLGYQISLFNIIGISVIILGLIFLFINHGLGKKGIGYVIFSTINAVATISLYKYMISNGSSVEAFCIVASSIVLTFLFIMAKWRYKENPFKFLLKKQFMVQALSRGISSVLISFAYIFAPASSIAGGRRGVAVLAGILSGKAFFNEKHILIKITSFILVVAGLILLMV